MRKIHLFQKVRDCIEYFIVPIKKNDNDDVFGILHVYGRVQQSASTDNFVETLYIFHFQLRDLFYNSY